MGLKQDLEAQLAAVQTQLAIVNRIPDDTFNFGTIVVLAYDSGTKHLYYVKTAEEAWRNMNGNVTQSLTRWIYENTQLPIGYFEVYVLSPATTPIFASA